MWFQPRTSVLTIMIAASALGGCSDIYYDRRETIAVGAGDAVATNRITQMVDPWPPNVSNRNIAFNGQRMESAIERYRQNKVIPPVGINTSSVPYQQGQPAAAVAVSPGASLAPAAPVR